MAFRLLTSSLAASCIQCVNDPSPLAQELKRLASTRGMSIDVLVEEARDTDRAGYASSTLREMLYGKKVLQIRAIVAFGNALDIDLSDDEEYKLRLVLHLIDESVHDFDVVLDNFKDLRIAKLPELTTEQAHQIPINHRQRQEAVTGGAAAAKPTKRRTSGA